MWDIFKENTCKNTSRQHKVLSANTDIPVYNYLISIPTDAHTIRWVNNRQGKCNKTSRTRNTKHLPLLSSQAHQTHHDDQQIQHTTQKDINIT